MREFGRVRVLLSRLSLFSALEACRDLSNSLPRLKLLSSHDVIAKPLHAIARHALEPENAVLQGSEKAVHGIGKLAVDDMQIFRPA